MEMRTFLRSLCCARLRSSAVASVVAPPRLAHAGPYEDALAGFTEGSLSDTGDAIDAVAASGNPLAAPLLEALQDARLMFSAEKKKVFIKTKDDKLLDAATGKPFTGTPPDDIDTVRRQQPAAQCASTPRSAR